MVEPVLNGTPEQRSEYYRQLQKKSRETYKGTGGFVALKKNNPEKLKEIQSKGSAAGVEARKRKLEENA